MHGRLRVEYRKRMTNKIQTMENMRQQRRLRCVFQMINLRERQHLDLSVLTRDGLVITQPADVHSELTDHFAQWYSIPSVLHPVAQNLINSDMWSALLEGQHLSDCGPSSFQMEAFCAACRYKVSEAQRVQFQDVLIRPISADEYSLEITNMKHGKAPGPSGATASMIKAWPANVHTRVLG